MKIYRFDTPSGKAVTQYQSEHFHVAHLVVPAAVTHVARLYLGENGVIGYHQTQNDQLFMVVSGEGWVRALGTERVTIKAGQAAFWKAGEWHKSGTDRGMVAVTIEGDAIRLDELVEEATYEPRRGVES